MYIPAGFKNANITAVKDFIKHNSFGILVSGTDTTLMATHIPLQLSSDESKLVGHISRANTQWKNFNSTAEVLTIFTGPHAYVSSSWYDHENVPTWNYIAVHVYGTIGMMEGDRLYDALKKMVDKYEQNATNPVALEKMSAAYIQSAMRGIVGFEITITRIEAAYKLSQNRDEKNYNNIIQALKAQHDTGALRVAEEMKKVRS